ncbi:hypothetical protein FIU97_02775 [Roseivivax sp. THAF40]|uniref:hypothetical protein n=1 Tax=Roseivivax sp. THAF40 TaxID=2587858 RepID=UPI0012A95D99|nr:hypothetical protein [Roseivivax sp. THAF40]QFT45489.1 hypothetical protein FIU97_02775 [Roseivivax sp. THAF40]
MQNTSHAVMAQRVEARESLDDFPTPPWALRALMEHVIERDGGTHGLSALEPACGRGHMAQSLKEYFSDVSAVDIHPYGYGDVGDFLRSVYATNSFDWVVTNPPFRLGEEFISRAMPIARRGVAVLVRTVFIESVGRYQRLFSQTPPTKVAQFTERVPMIKGRVDRKASTATGYAWVVWEKNVDTSSELVWIPPCRKKLERDYDYDAGFLNGESDRSEPLQHELFG